MLCPVMGYHRHVGNTQRKVSAVNHIFLLFAYITFTAALVALVGGALYALDNWLDRDEMETSTAKHRA